MKFSDLIASFGVIVLLTAFLANMYCKLPTQSKLYAFLNFFGAAICCYGAYLVRFYPFIILEGVWAIFGLLSLFKNHKSSNS
ncbi:CBU_0592 family membrane protein [Pedobacter aquatilis]|uniref:CBU_0592 family membrane protein n=1 Tax=Pedobacter aquatilis TaxID=351343 RepID=UPI0039773E61